MRDRLTQIWNGFADSTARSLDNTSIDNIPRPDPDSRGQTTSLHHHAPMGDMRTMPVPEGVTAPAQAAFAALRAQLDATAQQHGAQQHGEKTATSEAVRVPAPETNTGSAATTNTHVSANLSAGYARLQQDLQSTEQLTKRQEASYLASAADFLRISAQKPTKKKGFFGLFRRKG